MLFFLVEVIMEVLTLYSFSPVVKHGLLRAPFRQRGCVKEDGRHDGNERLLNAHAHTPPRSTRDLFLLFLPVFFTPSAASSFSLVKLESPITITAMHVTRI
jgi:hypothetical protein